LTTNCHFDLSKVVNAPDSGLVFLERAAARLVLVEAGEMDIETAIIEADRAVRAAGRPAGLRLLTRDRCPVGDRLSAAPE
jgi:hypothetical protein